MDKQRQAHWENIYQSREETGYSWFQPYPQTSVDLINALYPRRDARILDVGGGDSHLVDALLDLGYSDLTVLDISATAIDKARARLGKRADKVHWIVCDIAAFEPEPERYDLWHDRAAFHFLTADPLIRHYAGIARRAVSPGGHLILGTFSTKGPKKCSGLEICQYSRTTMDAVFTEGFRRIRCLEATHVTPSQVSQHFLFCTFKRRTRQQGVSLPD